MVAAWTVSQASLRDSVRFTYPPLGLEVGEKFKFSLIGYGQMGYELTHQNDETNHDFQVKRVVLVGNLAFGKHLKASVMVDVANTKANRRLQEAYLQWDFVPEIGIRVGQYKQPFMLENIYSPTILGTINMTEGTRYMSGIGGDLLQGSMAGRDLGIMVTGKAFPMSDGHRFLHYSLGVFNGAGLNTRDNNKAKDVIGMVQLYPLKNLMLTSSFIIGRGHAIEDSPYGDIKAEQNYDRRRWSIGVDYTQKPLYLRSEYTMGWNGDIRSRAFYAEAWVTLFPKFDLVLNFDHLNRNTGLDKDDYDKYPICTQNNNFTVGFQYWVWNRCRVASQYTYSNRPKMGDVHQWKTLFQFAF